MIALHGKTHQLLKCLTVLMFVMFVNKVMAQQNKSLTLWYNKPAKDWNEALPLGNGRIGAMVFGNIQDELIQLNEQSLWTGGPANLNPNPDAPKYLQPVRDALFKDSIGQAVKLLRKMQGPNTQMYQPLGDIIIHQTLEGNITDYYRDLNIADATATTSFTVNGIVYKREMFVSYPAQVFIIKLTASQKSSLNCSIDVQHELKYQKAITADKELLLTGKARINNDERRNPKPFIYEDAAHNYGMRFQFRIKALLKDGTLSNTDSSLIISNATEVVLYVSAATSFNGYNKNPDRDGLDENKKQLIF